MIKKNYLLSLTTVLSVLAATGLSLAKDTQSDGCTEFKWPINQEMTWFADEPEVHKSGASVSALPSRSIELQLAPHNDVNFAVKPEREPFEDGPNGGTVSFSTVSGPGIYQFSINVRAWIDVVVDGKAVTSSSSSNSRTCPAVRKSVRFVLSDGPVTVQVSSVKETKLRLAVRKIESEQSF